MSDIDWSRVHNFSSSTKAKMSAPNLKQPGSAVTPGPSRSPTLTRSTSRPNMLPLVPGYSSSITSSTPDPPAHPASDASGTAGSVKRKLSLRSRSKPRPTSVSSYQEDKTDHSWSIPHISMTQSKLTADIRAARTVGQMDPLAAHLEDMAGGTTMSREHTPDPSSDEDGDEAEEHGRPLRRASSQAHSPDKAAGTGKLKSKKSFFDRFRRDKKSENDHTTHLDSQFSIADFEEASMFDGEGDKGKQSRQPVKVKINRKPKKDFDELARVQVLGRDTMGLHADLDRSTDNGIIFSANDVDAEIKGPVWALRFSKCGRYLAAAGQDTIIRVWKLSRATGSPSTEEGPNGDSAESSKHVSPAMSMGDLGPTDAMPTGRTSEPSIANASSPIFDETPYRVYKGHTAPVLDITWSGNGFLASASMDKTVRIWHIDREECLCCLLHKGCVTSARFHPTDDRYVLTGSLDARIRLWSIEEKRVMAWNETPNGSYVTAVSFTRDGSMCAAGTFTGDCIFYEVDGLKYNTQIEVKSTKDRHSKKKITGIEPLPYAWGGEERLLITSNDSRIRMYNVRDKSLVRKYKGLECRASQIKATFSDDGRFLIAGSEDRQVYIWNLYPLGSYGGYGHHHPGTDAPASGSLLSGFMHWQADASRSSSWERFPGSTEAITCTVFAPKGTKDILYGPTDSPMEHHDSQSMYDLMNYSTEGCLIVIADMMGRIRVFENRNVGPQDLSSVPTSPKSPPGGRADHGAGDHDMGSGASMTSKRYSSPPQIWANNMRRSVSDLTGGISYNALNAADPMTRSMTPPAGYRSHGLNPPLSPKPLRASEVRGSTEVLETHFPARTATPRSISIDGASIASSSHLSVNDDYSDTGSPNLDAIIADISQGLAARAGSTELRRPRSVTYSGADIASMTAAAPSTVFSDTRSPHGLMNSKGMGSLQHLSSHASADVAQPARSHSRDFLNLPRRPLSGRHSKESSIDEES
ncbi:hypothetical protein PhCBS80983_g01825 [Powellomyces hirtus]|uniref:Anaphase-promoting complex subunit 4 WD40 domain-containing protein n=1 Tax=Powellomyces hirtus TaxID=109895 RepID=A0A507E980_9FUNG|nr:hypothetical protein PhCBS80983_g01825 [Powellomyces hirtus]